MSLKNGRFRNPGGNPVRSRALAESVGHEAGWLSCHSVSKQDISRQDIFAETWFRMGDVKQFSGQPG
jgi:hypothetical protein